MKYTEFSPPPWRWKRGDGEECLDQLIDGKGFEVCDFGSHVEYSAGTEPTLGDSVLIEIAREMYDLLLDSNKAFELNVLVCAAKVRAGICPLCEGPIINIMDTELRPSQCCLALNGGAVQCGSK